MAKSKKNKKLTIEEALVPVEEQPYKVPENWCWTRVKYVSDVVTGSTPSKKNEEYYGGDFPFFKPADLDAGDNVIEASEYLSEEGKSASRIIPELSTAVCCIGSIGKSGLLKVEGTTNQQINSMIPKINPLYLYYYSKTNEFIGELWDKSTATTISLVNKKNMETNTVPLAPLAEQQRIVEQIESLFSKLDEAKEKVQSVLEEIDNRKSAILLSALDGNYTEVWRKNNGISKDTWVRKRIDEISDVKGGKRVPKGMSLVFEDTGHPYIKAGNLKRGTVIDDGMQYVPDDVLIHIKNYIVNTGDVYITNVGACIGDCGVIPEQYDGANLTENAVKMTNLRECESQYLAYYLSSNYVQQLIRGLIASATLGKLSIANIKGIAIDLPTMEEQKEIIGIIKNVFGKEDLVKETIQNVIDDIEVIKKSILAKAFRGELGTNNLEEESSIELLKMILDKE